MTPAVANIAFGINRRTIWKTWRIIEDGARRDRLRFEWLGADPTWPDSLRSVESGGETLPAPHHRGLEQTARPLELLRGSRGHHRRPRLLEFLG